ncbi:MAG: DUF1801 domain-containing protein [Reinekea sp.]
MNDEIKRKFQAYPAKPRAKLKQLRELILSVADELNLGPVTESLKWNEPSYSVKGGSPVRYDWKEKSPQQVAIYFVCTTKLVATFKQIYGDLFQYQGKRAIVFQLNDELPVEPLRHCIELALTYQKVKDSLVLQ